MSRLRGNAHKKKMRLSSSTLSAAMEVAPQPSSAQEADTAVATAPTLEVDFNILDLLRAEPDTVVVPAAYNEASSVFTGAPSFPTTRYVFGLMICTECRNEVFYYQQRDLLAAGYRFRCRFCQHELEASFP